MLSLVFSSSHEDPYNEWVAKWVMKRTGLHRALIPKSYIGISVVDEDRKMLAGIVYHDFLPTVGGAGGKIEVSMAADNARWCQRHIIRGLLHYPFYQSNCHVLIATTDRTNRRTRKLLQGLGFTERGIIPNRPFTDDTVIYALRREIATSKWKLIDNRSEAA